MKNLIALIVTGICLSSAFTGCVNKDKAPLIPPSETMIMDFSDYVKDTSQTKSTLADTSHFWFSTATVVVWNSLIGITCAIPFLSYKEALKHQAVHQHDDSWLWTFSVRDNWNAFYTCKLSATDMGTTINWEMRLSKSGWLGYDNFRWYHGVSYKDGSKGTWTLCESPSNPIDFLKIEWNRDKDIKYTLLKHQNPMPISGIDSLYGSFIYYGKTSNDLNRVYNIYYMMQNCDIEWNHEDLHGRVRAPYFYHNDDWHCWGTNLGNTVCE